MILFTLTDLTRDSSEMIAGRSVLLVEDDYLVGLSIKSMLERIGCRVHGPVASVAQAKELIEQTQLNVDVGVLDINIAGGTSVPIAEMLQALHRPFVFVSGYQSPSHLLPPMLRQACRLTKPIDEQSLARALSDVMA